MYTLKRAKDSNLFFLFNIKQPLIFTELILEARNKQAFVGL